MKYLPTINLWAGGIESAIRSGQLKLQCGQWVRCGTDSQLSRFVSATKYCINVAHGGSNKEVIKRFHSRIQIRGLK